MRYVLLLVLFTFLAGCASQAPVTPEFGVPEPVLTQSSDRYDPHMLWGKWTLYFPAERDRVDVVPQRLGRFHLNATKFLEVNCTDCLQITGLHNNGDSTINLDVQIKHPFPNYPQYTGFDVKGIIMFNGSMYFPQNYHPPVHYPPNDYNARVSWRELGDPELLNPDGYSFRWSPQWIEDPDLPIFKYFPGKYSSGTPTANINGYLDFYSLENRHIFHSDSIVTRTYHIYLPPGQPVVAGYAIEACWAPPSNQPVTDPVNDFPITANQPEPYLFKFHVNNGEPITESPCCIGEYWADCSRFKVECASWPGLIPGNEGFTYINWYYQDGFYSGHGSLWDCDPKIDSFYYNTNPFFTYNNGNGIHRYLGLYYDNVPGDNINLVYTMIDFIIDID